LLKYVKITILYIFFILFNIFLIIIFQLLLQALNKYIVGCINKSGFSKIDINTKVGWLL